MSQYKTCCFFGEENQHSLEILGDILESLVKYHHIQEFISYGNSPFTLAVEEAVLSLKKHFPQLRLVAASPTPPLCQPHYDTWLICPEQGEQWLIDRSHHFFLGEENYQNLAHYQADKYLFHVKSCLLH